MQGPLASGRRETGLLLWVADFSIQRVLVAGFASQPELRPWHVQDYLQVLSADAVRVNVVLIADRIEVQDTRTPEGRKRGVR